MKKAVLCLTVFVVLIASQCFTVLAVSGSVDETIGYIIDVEDDVLHISGDALTAGGFSKVAVQVGDAPIYDLLTGLPISLCGITPEMSIRTAYGSAVAGLPSPAVVIWVNWDYDDAAAFTVTVSENIHYCPDGVVFLSTDGRYRVALTDDILILDYHHNLLNSADIVPGMEFFVWVDMITASSPALVYPDKVVLVY